MALPKNISDSVKEIEEYLFAVMSMGVVLSKSSSDDIYNVSAPLQLMGRGIIEQWEILREYLERQEAKPNLTSIRLIKDDAAE
jgi:DNA-binding TFAR19-related protein (PDSD5 family)